MKNDSKLGPQLATVLSAVAAFSACATQVDDFSGIPTGELDTAHVASTAHLALGVDGAGVAAVAVAPSGRLEAAGEQGATNTAVITLSDTQKAQSASAAEAIGEGDSVPVDVKKCIEIQQNCRAGCNVEFNARAAPADDAGAWATTQAAIKCDAICAAKLVRCMAALHK